MSKSAIIETGSKQYLIEPNVIIEVERIEPPEKDALVSLDRVLFFRDGETVHFGTPTIDKAKVICEYLGEIRGPKVISFKFRRRKASRRKRGHRQEYARLLVKDIKIG